MSPGGGRAGRGDQAQLRGCWPLVLPVVDCWDCCQEARPPGDSPSLQNDAPLPTTCSLLASPYGPHLGLHTGGPLSHQPLRRVPHCPTYPGRSPRTPLANCLSTPGLYLPPKPQLVLPITFLNTLPQPGGWAHTHSFLLPPAGGTGNHHPRHRHTLSVKSKWPVFQALYLLSHLLNCALVTAAIMLKSGCVCVLIMDVEI